MNKKNHFKTFSEWLHGRDNLALRHHRCTAFRKVLRNNPDMDVNTDKPVFDLVYFGGTGYFQYFSHEIRFNSVCKKCFMALTEHKNFDINQSIDPECYDCSHTLLTLLLRNDCGWGQDNTENKKKHIDFSVFKRLWTRPDVDLDVFKKDYENESRREDMDGYDDDAFEAYYERSKKELPRSYLELAVRHNRVPAVELIINDKRVDVNQRDEYGRTPLFYLFVSRRLHKYSGRGTKDDPFHDTASEYGGFYSSCRDSDFSGNRFICEDNDELVWQRSVGPPREMDADAKLRILDMFLNCPRVDLCARDRFDHTAFFYLFACPHNWDPHYRSDWDKADQETKSKVVSKRRKYEREHDNDFAWLVFQRVLLDRKRDLPEDNLRKFLKYFGKRFPKSAKVIRKYLKQRKENENEEDENKNENENLTDIKLESLTITESGCPPFYLPGPIETRSDSSGTARQTSGPDDETQRRGSNNSNRSQ